jgi:hypothetical protein
MRLIIAVAFLLIVGCSTVKSPGDVRPETTPGTACWTKCEQLALDNARLGQLLLDDESKLARIQDARDPKAQSAGREDAGREDVGERKIECVLAEMRALQQCEIWYRSERSLALFDLKMQQCVQGHSYFESPGDCPRRAP